MVFVTSVLWATLFTGLGFLFERGTQEIGVIGIGMIIVALLALGGFYKYMNSSTVVEQIEK